MAYKLSNKTSDLITHYSFSMGHTRCAILGDMEDVKSCVEELLAQAHEMEEKVQGHTFSVDDPKGNLVFRYMHGKVTTDELGLMGAEVL